MEINCVKILTAWMTILFLQFSVTFEVLAEPRLDPSKPPDSAWGWEVSGRDRKVYLLGELHGFVGDKNFVVAHDLGLDIYETVSEVWVEAQQANPQSRAGDSRIQSTLSKKTWTRIESSVLQATSSIFGKTDEHTEALAQHFINQVKSSDPGSAYANFGILFLLKQRKVHNQSFYPSPGLGWILQKVELSSNANKIRKLETDTSIYDAWWSRCDSPEKAELLVNSGLDKLESEFNLETDRDLIFQKIFLTSNSKLSALDKNLWSTRESVVLRECIVTPRNEMWVEKIVEELDGSGEPVAFLVGIGHIGGEMGLISLLNKRGYVDIKRVYSVASPEKK